MSYRPDRHHESEWYDDIDRLFELSGQATPPPGPAFQETLDSLRNWEIGAVQPVKAGTLAQVWSSIKFAALVTVGGLVVVITVFALVISANPANGPVFQEEQSKVLTTVTQDDQSAFVVEPLKPSVALPEADNLAIPRATLLATPTKAARQVNQFIESDNARRLSNLEQLAQLEKSYTGSGRTSNNDKRTEDNKNQFRPSNRLH